MNFQEVYNDGTVKVTRSQYGWGVWVRPAVTTLLIQDGKIILIEDKKTENDRWLWNCPGGMIEAGETSEQAAARECEEEVGLIPRKLEKFTTVQTDFPDTYIDYYLGSELHPGQKANWVEENIGKIQEHSWAELYEMAMNYELRDPRLVVAILLLSKQNELLLSYHLI